MTANTHETATIYQFPLRGRFAPDYREALNSSANQIANVESGSGWYHQEAIEDAAKLRKN